MAVGPQGSSATEVPVSSSKVPVVGFGMAASVSTWDQRLAEVGPGIMARRIFLSSFTARLSLPYQALSDGMYPVISFKTGGISWADVAGGLADAQLAYLASRLDSLPGDVFVAVHHEPFGDGPPADWAAMQEHVLPILGAPDNVTVGVILNGWFWSLPPKGYSDEQIATYVTPGVLAVSEVVAADTYDSATDPAAVKVSRFLAWADRVGVSALGIGEFNGWTSASITNVMNLAMSDPRIQWANIYNAKSGKVTVLTDDRLAAFQAGLAQWLAM